MIRNLLQSVALTGLLAGAGACTNHPPLYGDTGDGGGGADVSDGGVDGGGGRPDVGVGDGGSGGDAGIPPDAGPVCQVRFPVAVLFYDCADMAPAGGPVTRVCLSDQEFGGDASAARQYVERGLEITRALYVNGCAPLAMEFDFFTPDRVVNARVGDPGMEFSGWDRNHDGVLEYGYGPGISNLVSDLTALGADPQHYGAYVVMNGWSGSILVSDAPATHNLSFRTAPPYSVVGFNLHEGVDPALPANIKATLRHELDHGLENIASVNGFTRHIPTHDEVLDVCAYGGDERRLCQLFNGVDGAPLTVDDWSAALGPVGVPVSCDDPERVSHCAEAPTAACGDVDCPPLPGYSPSCNPQGYCEYAPLAPAGAWRVYDRWIYVPAGSTFAMGSVDSPAEASEGPVRAVTFSIGYFLGKYEVPVEAYEGCEADASCPSRFINNWDGDGWGINDSVSRAFHPANAVLNNAGWQACEWIYPGARFAGESEWEFAARGPTSLLYPHGSLPPSCASGLATFNELGGAAGFGCGTGGTTPVGSNPSGISPIGAFNMAGNVWEWVADDWHDDYTGAPTDGFPWNGGGWHPWYRTIRGGAFNDAASKMRGSQRYRFWYAYGNANVGARCAISANRTYREHP